MGLSPQSCDRRRPNARGAEKAASACGLFERIALLLYRIFRGSSPFSRDSEGMSPTVATQSAKNQLFSFGGCGSAKPLKYFKRSARSKFLIWQTTAKFNVAIILRIRAAGI